MRRGFVLALALALAACSNEPIVARAVGWDSIEIGDLPEPESPPTLPASATPALASEAAYGSRPKNCERFVVIQDDKGRNRYKRIRKRWTHDDTKRFRKLVGMIAREMGAEARLFQAWSLRESSYRPSALHVLNPDVAGAATAWRRFAYSRTEEKKLEAVLASSDAKGSAFWRARGRLKQIRRFKENPFLGERVRYDIVHPDGTVEHTDGSAWAFGYGPFGFNPTYFLPVWDARSPPWVFCHDDGLIAVVTAIWSARAHQRECERQGIGGSYSVVNRRFASGHCVVPDPASPFKKRMSRLGIDADARAKLGRRFKRGETDRNVLLAHLRHRAVAEGLLPTTVLADN